MIAAVRYHCPACGKRLGCLTPPFEIVCRRCGTVIGGKSGNGVIVLTIRLPQPTLVATE